MPQNHLQFRRLSGSYVVCRLAPEADVPVWATASEGLISITRTADELSIVCPSEGAPKESASELRWACFKLEGPFAFSAVGILNSFIAPLADAGIPIFAVSTYDTDYVLVREGDTSSATEALQRAGHQLIT